MQDRMDRSLAAVLHTPDYSNELLVKGERFFLVCTRYPEYPLQFLDLPDYEVVIEGKLYGLNDDEITREMSALTQLLFEKPGKYHDLMTNWLLNTDGDFIIFVLSKKTRRIAILNDALGRLPWYCFRQKEAIVLSREVRFIAKLLEQRNYDRMGIAQFLLFGYPLGDRTLLEDVKRLPPSTLVRIDEGASDPSTSLGTRISLERLHVFNFDSKLHADKTIEENSAELVGLFRRSCQRRATGIYERGARSAERGAGERGGEGTSRRGSELFNSELEKLRTRLRSNAEGYSELRCTGGEFSAPTNSALVVSLSGGLDSRTVAAGFHALNIPFVCATFLQSDKSNAPEVTVAAELARSLNWDWQTFFLSPPLGRHCLQLLRMKNGLNSLGMSYILPFFEKLRETYSGGMTYYTGDGGDKVFPDWRPARPLRNLERTVDFILQRHQTFSLNTVAALTQMNPSDIRDELAARLAAYPEQDLAQKCVHFIIYERGMKWLFEGEDRNRFYFWSGSPFYSIQFFTYAMNCPDSQKSRYLLYRRVLEELSPLAAETPDDNVGLPPASRWHGLKRTSKTWIQDWLSASLRRRLKHSLFPRLRSGQAYNPQSLLVRCLREQLDSCDAPGGCLSNATLKSIIDNVRHHSRFEMENLFAVTSWVEELDRGYSSIEPYNDVRFS